jgi:hypothetical protein
MFSPTGAADHALSALAACVSQTCFFDRLEQVARIVIGSGFVVS